MLHMNMYNKFEYPSYKVENGRHPQVQTHMDAIDASKRGLKVPVYSIDKQGCRTLVATYLDGKHAPTEFSNLKKDFLKLWKTTVFKAMK